MFSSQWSGARAGVSTYRRKKLRVWGVFSGGRLTEVVVWVGEGDSGFSVSIARFCCGDGGWKMQNAKCKMKSAK